MDYKGVFLDDREDAEYFAELLCSTGSDSLSVVFQKANLGLEDQAKAILEERPSAVALDYRLSDQQAISDVGIRYKAGPLAQQLRDYAIENPSSDFPIVLLSAEEIKADEYEPDLTTHDLFDRVYVKEELVREPEKIKKELLSLAVGYKKICNAWLQNPKLSNFLQVGDDDYLLEGQEIRRLSEVKAPHQLARVLLKNFISRNGLLLDRSAVLAVLGVAPDSPGSDINQLLTSISAAGAEYTGVFDSGWQRWWRYRVEAVFTSQCGDSPGNLSSAQRVNCLNRIFGISLLPAKSKWSIDEEVFPGFACASCGHPTENKHSVGVFDEVPGFVEQRRICWDCVDRGLYTAMGFEVAEAHEFILGKIESGDLNRG